MNNNIYISIVIPAYNEEFRIRPTLNDIYGYMQNRNYEYEIIVVDDGSKDDTSKVANEYKTKFRNLKVLRNEVNMGKGYSVNRGMLEALGELRLFMDADNSVKISNLDSFINHIKSGNDIAIGSIEIGEGKVVDNNVWYRRGMGKLSKWLIRHTVAPYIYDTQRGFKIFTKSAVETVFPLQTIYRWGFDIEILAIAIKKNLKIKEISVDWDNSAGSSVNLGSYIKTLFELVKILTKKY